MGFSHTNCGYIFKKGQAAVVWLGMAPIRFMRKNLNFLKIDLAVPANISDYTIFVIGSGTKHPRTQQHTKTNAPFTPKFKHVYKLFS